MSFAKRLREIEKKVENENKKQLIERVPNPFGEAPATFFADLIPALEDEIESHVRNGAKSPYYSTVCWNGRVRDDSTKKISESWKSFYRWFQVHTDCYKSYTAESARVFEFVQQAVDLIADLWNDIHPDVTCIAPKGTIPDNRGWGFRFEWQ